MRTLKTKKDETSYKSLFGGLDALEYDSVIWGVLVDSVRTSHNYKQSCYNPQSCLRECYYNLFTNKRQVIEWANISLDKIRKGSITINTNATTTDKEYSDPLAILGFLDNQQLMTSTLSEPETMRLALQLFTNKVQNLMWQNTKHYFTKSPIDVNVVNVSCAKSSGVLMAYMWLDGYELEPMCKQVGWTGDITSEYEWYTTYKDENFDVIFTICTSLYGDGVEEFNANDFKITILGDYLL